MRSFFSFLESVNSSWLLNKVFELCDSLTFCLPHHSTGIRARFSNDNEHWIRKVHGGEV